MELVKAFLTKVAVRIFDEAYKRTVGEMNLARFDGRSGSFCSNEMHSWSPS